MQTFLKFLYLLSLAFWIGSIFFFSLFTAPSIFKVLPRETAGELVSHIFPKYYMVAYTCGGLAIISSILLWVMGNSLSAVSNGIRIGILIVMLGLAAYAGVTIRHQALEARSEMRTLVEDSPRYKEVKNRFDRIHRESVIINSAVFLLGIAIVFFTAYTNRE